MDNVAEIIKHGVVSSVDPVKATARVTFPDRDDVVSFDLPIMFASTGFVKIYSMPKVKQPVKCSFLGTGLEDGFIDGGFYNDENPPPTTNPSLHMIHFEDGSSITYDADSKSLTMNIPGGVNINGLNIGPDGTLTLKDGTIVDTHFHTQGNDSAGNSQQPTDGPQS